MTPRPRRHRHRGPPGRSRRGHGASVSNARNVPGFMNDVALGPAVTASFGGTPVLVDNDVRAAVMGEFRRGAGQPFRDFLGVFGGPGVGGGLILEGELRHGLGNAGEIGQHPRSSRVVAGAGATGSAVWRGGMPGASRSNSTARQRVEKGQKTKLFEIMERKGRDRVTSSVIADALEQNDRLTIELVDEAVDALGMALATAQNLLDLEAIIVGGGLGDRLGEPFVRRVEQAMAANLRFPDRPPVVPRPQRSARAWSGRGRRHGCCFRGQDSTKRPT